MSHTSVGDRLYSITSYYAIATKEGFMLLLYLQLGTIHFIISLEMEQTNSLFLLLTAFIMVLYGQSITYNFLFFRIKVRSVFCLVRCCVD